MRTFRHRGLTFRSCHPIGLQVWDGARRRWFDTDFWNRAALEAIPELPDLALWSPDGTRTHCGSLRFSCAGDSPRYGAEGGQRD